MSKKLTEKEVIDLFNHLEQGWPDDLWLGVVSGTLCLMGPGFDKCFAETLEIYPDIKVECIK